MCETPVTVERGVVSITTPPASIQQRPKGIVILFGWTGSIKKHVQKYADLYDDSFYKLVGIFPVTDIMTANRPAMQRFAGAFVKEAVAILREHSNLPLITHTFSNNGAYPLTGLGSMLKNPPPELPEEDAKLVANAWSRGIVIQDSAPAFITMKQITQVLSHAVKNPVAFGVGWLVVSIVYYTDQAWAYLWNRPDLFEQMGIEQLEGVGQVCPRIAFIYSTADTITPYSKLEDFVEKFRVVVGEKNLFVLKFTDSAHVLHLRSHPEEYKNFVNEMVDKCASP